MFALAKYHHTHEYYFLLGASIHARRPCNAKSWRKIESVRPTRPRVDCGQCLAARATIESEFVHNELFPVAANMVSDAIMAADTAER